MITLTSAVAGEHRSDLLRDAARARRGALMTPDQPADRAPGLTLRLAEPGDRDDVHRLEALDETPALAGRILLASRGDEVIAALSLTDGRVAANPFVPTVDAVALLRVRAAHLSAPRLRGRRRRRWPLGRPLRWA